MCRFIFLLSFPTSLYSAGAPNNGAPALYYVFHFIFFGAICGIVHFTLWYIYGIIHI